MSANGISGPHGIDTSNAPFAVASPARTATDPLPTFDEVLRAINPLQYVPIVGTIYRVVTGDEGSPGLRTAVSAVAGMAMGGPVGLLLSMAGSLFERVFHLDAAAHTLIAGAGPVPPPTSMPPTSMPPTSTPPTSTPPSADAPPTQAVVTRAIGAYSLSQGLAGIG